MFVPFVWIFLALLISCFILSYYTKRWWILLVPYALFILHEAVYIITGKYLLISPVQKTQMYYDICNIGMRTGISDTDTNFTEGHYPNDDYTISAKEAENAKFAYILKLLNVKEGDRILDLGCGWCTFLQYAKDHGVHMTGVTNAPLLVESGKQKGLDVVLWDFNTLNPNFVGKFDHVIHLGSLEHADAGRVNDMQSYDTHATHIVSLFTMYRSYFDPTSCQKKLFISVFHMIPEVKDDWGAFWLQMAYGGLYFIDDGQRDVASCGKKAGYNVLHTSDETKSYYMASVLDPRHFGNTTPIVSATSIISFVGGFVYPYLWYYFVYAVTGTWMWQFDRKFHYKLFPSSHNDYTLEKPGAVPCPLKYVVLQDTADEMPSSCSST
jgi:hypothetical protein